MGLQPDRTVAQESIVSMPAPSTLSAPTIPQSQSIAESTLSNVPTWADGGPASGTCRIAAPFAPTPPGSYPKKMRSVGPIRVFALQVSSGIAISGPETTGIKFPRQEVALARVAVDAGGDPVVRLVRAV